eukprot:1154637-Pelagomonas_calceolata.AAC.5
MPCQALFLRSLLMPESIAFMHSVHGQGCIHHYITCVNHLHSGCRWSCMRAALPQAKLQKSERSTNCTQILYETACTFGSSFASENSFRVVTEPRYAWDSTSFFTMTMVIVPAGHDGQGQTKPVLRKEVDWQHRREKHPHFLQQGQLASNCAEIMPPLYESRLLASLDTAL